MSYLRSLPLTLLIAIPALAQEKHQLRLRFVPGTVVHYTMGQEMDMTMNMGAQDMSTTMNMLMFMSTTVKAVNDNVADLEQEITRIKAVMNNPMMKVDFDSDIEDSDPGMLEGMAELVGEKTKMKMSDMGKLSDVEVGEALARNAKQSGLDMEQMMSQSVTMLPDKPIAIGETWKNAQKMPMGQMGDMETQVVNKLVSVDDKYIVVDQVIQIDTADMELPGGMELEKMEASGTNKIDVRTGMPAEMTMTVKMKMAGQMAMEMVIKQTIKQTAPPKKKGSDAKKGDAKKGDAKEPAKSGK